MRTTTIRAMLAMGVAAAALTFAAEARAQARQFNIPAQEAVRAIPEFGRQAGVQIVAPADLLRGVRTPSLRGTIERREALTRLLAGTGLEVASDDGRVIILRLASRPHSEVTDAIKAATVEEVMVTGSLLRTSRPPASPVRGVGRAEIERNDFATSEAVVQSLPQVFAGGATSDDKRGDTGTRNVFETGVNLRGLGEGATLTLLNGKRLAPSGAYGFFSSISSIPATALERVEIVPDGASATYGSDAIAGVVNFILRRDFDGAESALRVSGTTEGGGETFRASQIFGRSGSVGSFLLGYEYFRQNSLAAAQRNFSETADLRSRGGSDRRVEGSNILGATGTASRFALPLGTSNRDIVTAPLVLGTRNLIDQNLFVDLLPKIERHGAYASAQWRPRDFVEFSFDGLYSTFKAEGPGPARTQIFAVPVTNAFINQAFANRVNATAGQSSVRVLYDWSLLAGPRKDSNDNSSFSVSLGSTWRLPHRWKFDSFVAMASNTARYTNENLYVNTFYANPLLASADPQVAFNPFGNDPNLSPENLERVKGFQFSDDKTRAYALEAKFDGPLLNMPAGDVLGAFGASHRRETLDHRLYLFRTTATLVEEARDRYHESRDIDALFAELRIPLWPAELASSIIKSIDVSASGRYERYEDVGDTFNGKLGGVYVVNDVLSFTATAGESFRAPRLYEAPVQSTVGTTFSVNTTLPDPTSPTGRTVGIAMFGGNPDLKPETATSWTLGAHFRRGAADGFSASLNYFAIHYRNRVQLGTGLSSQILTREALFPDQIERNPSAARVQSILSNPQCGNCAGFVPSDIRVIYDDRFINVGTVDVAGIDLQASYSWRTDWGRLAASVDVSRMFEYVVRASERSPAGHFDNTVGYPADLRGRATLYADMDWWRVNLVANYTDDLATLDQTLQRRLKSSLTFDAAASVRLPERFGEGRLTLGVVNIFDRDPPFYDDVAGRGYETSAYDPQGRTISLELKKAW